MTFRRLTRTSCALLFVLAACKPGTTVSSTSPPSDDSVVGSVCARDQDCTRGAAGPNPPLSCLFGEGCGGAPTGRCGEAMGECVVARPFCDCAGKTQWGCVPTGRYKFRGTCEDGGGI